MDRVECLLQPAPTKEDRLSGPLGKQGQLDGQLACGEFTEVGSARQLLTASLTTFDA